MASYKFIIALNHRNVATFETWHKEEENVLNLYKALCTVYPKEEAYFIELQCRSNGLLLWVKTREGDEL